MADYYGGRRPTILAIDDEDLNLMRLKAIFMKEADVVCVTSGPEGLDWLKENEADIVLLDFRMPKMDGITILRSMKKIPFLADTPVIIMTGDIEAELEAEGFFAGANDFIRKPFIPDVIRERVRRLLRYEYLQEHLTSEVNRQTKLASDRLASSLRLYHETVLALAKTIDAKDAYTSGHSERVAAYSREIARLAGEDEDAQDDIYTTGLLHDIGKIGIPGAIINKPSRLTDEEYAVIKSHTTVGSEILSLIKERPNLSIGARYHHERYDGRGYPDGVAGEAIPKFARIIAVADAYDAMTSKRSYRDVLPQEVVRSEIEKGAGIQFDPQYARVMLKMIDDDVNYTMHE